LHFETSYILVYFSGSHLPTVNHATFSNTVLLKSLILLCLLQTSELRRILTACPASMRTHGWVLICWRQLPHIEKEWVWQCIVISY